jgi:hypothetical protein
VIEVSTVTELDSLLDLIDKRPEGAQTSAGSIDERIRAFVSEIDANHRWFLEAAGAEPSGTPEINMVSALNLEEPRQLGGLLMGLSKRARKFNLTPEDFERFVVTRRRVRDQATQERRRTYKLRPETRAALEALPPMRARPAEHPFEGVNKDPPL